MEKVINEITNFDIREKIIEALNDQNQIYSVKLLIQNHINQDRESYFEKNELEWLFHKLEFVIQIVENENASGIFYWLKKQPSINAYIISQKLGVYYKTIQYWIKKFTNSGLIICRERYRGEGNINQYYLNDKIHNVNDMIFELIKTHKGTSIFAEFNKNNNVHWDSIQKWRKRNPEVAKKYRHNSKKKY